MPDYKTMYFQLAARVADVVDLLVEAQRQGEEAFASETPDIIDFSSPRSAGEACPFERLSRQRQALTHLRKTQD